MATSTLAYAFSLPEVGGDINTWGTFLNANWEKTDDLLSGVTPVDGIDVVNATLDLCTITNTDFIGGTLTAATIDLPVITTPTITDGTAVGLAISDTTVENSPIGGVTPSTGAFTTLSASGAANFSTIAATSTTRLADTGDVSLVSTGHSFQIGADAAANVRLDSNELQSVNNGVATGFNINIGGGDVALGNSGSVISTTGTMNVGGTLNNTGGEVNISNPVADLNIDDTNGVVGGSIAARVNYKASGAVAGRTGFATSSGTFGVSCFNGAMIIVADENNTSGNSVVALRSSLTTRLEANNSGVEVTGRMLASGSVQCQNQFLGPEGTQGTPTYSFAADGNTGMYLLNPSEIRMTLNGVLEHRFIGGNSTGDSRISINREKGDARYAQLSSQRFKDSIVTSDVPAMDICMSLEAKKWVWGGELPTTEESFGNRGFGMIAEEVEDIFPEAVKYLIDDFGEKRIHGLDPLAMCGILVECVKTLSDRIAVLEGADAPVYPPVANAPKQPRHAREAANPAEVAQRKAARVAQNIADEEAMEARRAEQAAAALERAQRPL